VKAALQQPPDSGVPPRIVRLSNPTLTRAEFYEYLAAAYRFSAAAAHSKTRFLAELESALDVTNGGPAPVTALVVDEAQSLPHELLEEVRLLTNVQGNSGQSLTVILAGQPELAGRLNEERLRQLKQRIVLRCELTPLNLQETAAYISARVRVAGGVPELLFTRDAVAAVYEHSAGIPRTVSVICDNALVSGYASDMKPIGREIILEVSRDFELGPATPPQPATVAPAAPAPKEVARPAPPAVPEVAHAGASEARDSRLFATFTRARRFFTF
jgi:general secretion pathway protein A